jgi:hypothetical protein
LKVEVVWNIVRHHVWADIYAEDLSSISFGAHLGGCLVGAATVLEGVWRKRKTMVTDFAFWVLLRYLNSPVPSAAAAVQNATG